MKNEKKVRISKNGGGSPYCVDDNVYRRPYAVCSVFCFQKARPATCFATLLTVQLFR